MNQSQMWLVLAGIVAIWIWWTMYSLKNKVIVGYRNYAGQRFVKLASIKDDHVYIDHKKFTILPDRRSFQWFTGNGLGWFLLGMWMTYYEFSFDSRYPHDPKNYKVNTYSPAVAASIDNEEGARAFARGVERQAGKKSGLNGWMPWLVVLCIVAIIGVAWWSTQQFQHVAEGQRNLLEIIKAGQK